MLFSRRDAERLETIINRARDCSYHYLSPHPPMYHGAPEDTLVGIIMEPDEDLRYKLLAAANIAALECSLVELTRRLILCPPRLLAHGLGARRSPARRLLLAQFILYLRERLDPEIHAHALGLAQQVADG